MKERSLDEKADFILGKKWKQWQREAKDTDNAFSTGDIRQKCDGFIEKVSNITLEAIAEAERAHDTIVIDAEEYLPGDLRIIKQLNSGALSARLTEKHDKKQSHNLAFAEFIANPSLFAEEDFVSLSTKWLVLGDSERVEVGLASEEQFVANDIVVDANWKAQETAYSANKQARKQRKKLFRKYPDCHNMTELYTKLRGKSGGALTFEPA